VKPVKHQGRLFELCYVVETGWTLVFKDHVLQGSARPWGNVVVVSLCKSGRATIPEATVAEVAWLGGFGIA
jgi:hypothetical protein